MSRNLTAELVSWIAEGFRFIGEIQISPLPEGGYELRHYADAGLTELASFKGPKEARQLSFFDSSGAYRPLKTAPTLKRGWSLVVSGGESLREALDHFYPAMTGLWLSQLKGSLHPVALRDTLNRQTGMYAATKRLQDAEGQSLVGEVCQSHTGCLKRKLWRFDADSGLHALPPGECSPAAGPFPHDPRWKEIPMLCHEACNLLVAACREVVKKRERASQAAAAGSTEAPSGVPGQNAGGTGQSH